MQNLFRLTIFKLIIINIIVLLLLSGQAIASSGGSTAALHPKKIGWEFDGFFGRFDKQSIQRGYQIYDEICSACHNLRLLHYRNLQEIGFSKEEVKYIAAEHRVIDGPDDNGDMFMRPALPSDKFVGPFANEQQARIANGGAFPPDLSLIVKARPNGANYIYSILTGFTDPVEGFELTPGRYYNPYFENRQIGMPPPLGDELVEYQDGTYPSEEQMAIDIVNFLQFAAEPEMEDRKKMGVRVIIFLIITIILFAISKKRIWRRVK